MSNFTEELVFSVLQYFDEEAFTETAHTYVSLSPHKFDFNYNYYFKVIYTSDCCLSIM